jgi:hypothetical protein
MIRSTLKAGVLLVDGLAEAAEKVKRKQWIQLIKVLVLTVWDQLGLEE